MSGSHDLKSSLKSLNQDVIKFDIPQRSWYVLGTFLVRSWYVVGTFLVRFWYVVGTLLVRSWYVVGTFLVRSWYVLGTLWSRCVGYFEKYFYLFLQSSYFVRGICVAEVDHKISQ